MNYTNCKTLQAFESGNCRIVLFDPDSHLEALGKSPQFGQFPNLVCFSENGDILWVAALPTTNTGDAYYQIVSEDPLIADSCTSFRCTIDKESGKILSKDFYK